MGSTLPSVASRLVIGLVTGMLMCACNQAPRSPTTPTAPTVPSTPPAPSGPTVTLSGIISERFSGRPIEGLRVGVWHMGGLFSMRPAGVETVLSDAAGRYRISGIPILTDRLWVLAGGSGPQEYWQQCAATVRPTSDTTLDLTLTSRANLSPGNSQPPSRTPGTRSISGFVFEMTADGRRPIADASVAWEPTENLIVAETSTDATGRYLLCGLAEDPIDHLFAYKAGYGVVSFNIGPGSDAVVDIEMNRR